MSIRRLFGLVLLFLFFEVAVWVIAAVLAPDTNPFLICAGMTGLAVAIWIIFTLLTRYLMRPHPPQAAPPRPPASVAIPPGSPRQSAELEDLQALLREANERLANAPGAANQRVKPTVTSLPLYLIAGIEGSGKTSTIVNSGLDPQLLAGEVWRESALVPTRLCNFWLAHDAIFADISGRFFSEDPARWSALLETLSGRRAIPWWRKIWTGRQPLQNLRGVVLFCDVNNFIQVGDPQKPAALGRRLQERLQAVGQAFGTSFLVYVIFSKAENLPYFGEYFARASEQEDQRVLGCTLPVMEAKRKKPGEVYSETENKRLTECFNKLYYSLADKRLVFLARESVNEKRPLVYEFPREVKRIRGDVVRFMVDLFRPNPLQPGPVLRGFYFAGVRRVAATNTAIEEAPDEFSNVRAGSEATVFFRPGELGQSVVSKSSRRSATARESTVLRWVFVSELFHNVILPDRVAVAEPAVDRRLELYRYAGFGALTLVCLVLSITFLRSWSQNRMLLNDVAEATKSASSMSTTSLQAMEALHLNLARLKQYERDGAPIAMRWGLYSGNRVLPDLRELYFRRFHKIFLQPILDSIHNKFLQLPAEPGAYAYNDTYDELKSYLMITSGVCQPDSALLTKALSPLWVANRSLDAESEVLANRQIQFYISELQHQNPYHIEENAVARDRARQYLASFKGPDRVYRALIDEVNKAPGQPARLAALAPNYQEVLTGQGEVEASFTREGWRVIQERIHNRNFTAPGETCVLGGGKIGGLLHGPELERNLQKLYIDGYIDAWRKFLSSQSIAPYRSTVDAAHKLGILVDSKSPLLAALFMTADNTNFAAAGQSSIQNTIIQKGSTLMGKAAGILRKGKDVKKQLSEPKNEVPQPSQADIPNAFQPVRAVIDPKNKEHWVDPANNQNYVNALAELKTAVELLPSDPNKLAEPAVYQQARKASDKAHEVVREMKYKFNNGAGGGVDAEVVRLLQEPITRADHYIPREATQPLKAKVNGKQQVLCGKLNGLGRKFPFSAQSGSEVSLEDLDSIFAPTTGALWGFRTLPAPLNNILEKKGDVWAQSERVQDPKLTPEFLQFFNKMARVSFALYGDTGNQPRLQYRAQILPMVGAPPATLEIDGTTVTSTSAAAATVNWPGVSSRPHVSLKLKIGEYDVPFGSYEGLWALSRLMTDRDLQQGSIFSFSKLRKGNSEPQPIRGPNGEPITVRLMFSFPTINIFDRSFLAVLGCPATAAE